MYRAGSSVLIFLTLRQTVFNGYRHFQTPFPISRSPETLLTYVGYSPSSKTPDELQKSDLNLTGKYSTVVSIVCSTGCSSAVQKYQSSTSLPLGRGIHWWPVDSPHEGPVTRKIFLFDDVIMYCTHFRDDGGLFGVVYDSGSLVWFLLAWYITNMWNTFFMKNV